MEIFDRGDFPLTSGVVLPRAKLAYATVGTLSDARDNAVLFPTFLGWSVGALQAYEWAVWFPQMVERMASIAGAARPSPWTRRWLTTCLEEPLTSVPNWNNGFYRDPVDVRAGVRRMALAAIASWGFKMSQPELVSQKPTMRCWHAWASTARRRCLGSGRRSGT